MTSAHGSGPAGGLHGKKALVTGGASGIGLACAQALAAAGAQVTVADRDGAAAQAAADGFGGEAWEVDLADTAALDGLTLDVDVLVNNAGFQHVEPIESFPPETFRAMLQVMLEAPFLLVRAALPHMYEEGFGRIINVSSVHGLRASPFKVAYVTVKHGLEGLSKVIAVEGGPKGVTSNCVNPAFVRTPLVEKQIDDQAAAHGISPADVVEKIMLTQPAIKRLIEPAEVADLVTWLAGPTAGFVNGASYVMDGGWTAR